MKKNLLFVFVAFTFASCFKKKEIKKEVTQEIYSNSCEPNQLWLNENTIKEVGAEAHSGVSACVLNEKIDFGLGIAMPIAKAMKNATLKKINVSLWVKAKKLPLNASVVYSIDSDTNLYWDAKTMKDMLVDTNKWVFLQFQKELPKIDIAKARISTYVLNGGKENFMVDDFSVTFEGE